MDPKPKQLPPALSNLATSRRFSTKSISPSVDGSFFRIIRRRSGGKVTAGGGYSPSPFSPARPNKPAFNVIDHPMPEMNVTSQYSQSSMRSVSTPKSVKTDHSKPTQRTTRPHTRTSRRRSRSLSPFSEKNTHSVQHSATSSDSDYIPFARTRSRHGCEACERARSRHNHEPSVGSNNTIDFAEYKDSSSFATDVRGIRRSKSTPLLKREQGWGKVSTSSSTPKPYIPLSATTSSNVSTNKSSTPSSRMLNFQHVTPRVPSHIVSKNNRPFYSTAKPSSETITTKVLPNGLPEWDSSTIINTPKTPVRKNILFAKDIPEKFEKQQRPISSLSRNTPKYHLEEKVIARPSNDPTETITRGRTMARKEYKTVSFKGIDSRESSIMDDKSYDSGMSVEETTFETIAEESAAVSPTDNESQDLTSEIKEEQVVPEDEYTIMQETEAARIENSEKSSEIIAKDADEINDDPTPTVSDAAVTFETAANDELTISTDTIADDETTVAIESTTNDETTVAIEPTTTSNDETITTTDTTTTIEGEMITETVTTTTTITTTITVVNGLTPIWEGEVDESNKVEPSKSPAFSPAEHVYSLNVEKFEDPDRMSIYSDGSSYIWGSEYGDDESERSFLLGGSELPAWRRSRRGLPTQRKRRVIDMKDLTGLATLISAKLTELVSMHQKLQSCEAGGTFKIVKANYIHSAREIVKLGKGISTSWQPVARACSDPVLSNHLLSSLVKVETLSSQMRAVTSMKSADETDRDRDGVIVASARNVVETTRAALSDLEAAQMRLDEEEGKENEALESLVSSQSA
ncbi:hypothetical protein HK098_003816 [Nowakowskiella sp. JEL0407]|nr:hypothetical protein HK098_003816 [Nowakowskiella sp. JEL0407]